MGIAAQFGITVGSADQAFTSSFYSKLVRTDEILLAAVRTRLPSHDAPLYEVLTGDTDSINTPFAAARQLRDDLYVNNDLEAGLVTIRFTHRDPEVAFAVANSVYRTLLEFDTRRRATRSRLERSFLESRLVEARTTETSRSEALVSFLESNKSLAQSASLQAERERLEFAVNQARSLLTALEDAYQQAQLSEVRDTPVITVVEEPYLPTSPEPARPILYAVLGASLGLCAIAYRSLRREFAASRVAHDVPAAS